jgi:hypothetical protein
LLRRLNLDSQWAGIINFSKRGGFTISAAIAKAFLEAKAREAVQVAA